MQKKSLPSWSISLEEMPKSSPSLTNHLRDFLGSPVVKTSPSNAGGMGLIPGQGTDKMYSTGGGNGILATPVFLPCEPHEQYEKAKRYDTRRWAPRLEVSQYATREKKRAIINTPRKNEEAGAKQKWHSAVGVSGGKSKISDAVKNNIA